MACKCATFDPDSGRYNCSVSGDGCMYMTPNSKRCAEEYDEGPDVDHSKSMHYASGVNDAMLGNCDKCCISCEKDKKQYEDYKERSRAINRAIYREKAKRVK